MRTRSYPTKRTLEQLEREYNMAVNYKYSLCGEYIRAYKMLDHNIYSKYSKNLMGAIIQEQQIIIEQLYDMINKKTKQINN